MSAAGASIQTPKTLQYKGFDIPQDMLYVLTGFQPECNDGTIRKGVRGPHLRFVFPSQKKGFQHVLLMLQIYQIRYFDELYKPKGENKYDQYITVDNTEFAKIKALFSKEAPAHLKSAKDFEEGTLDPEQQLSLSEIAELETRYAQKFGTKDEYSLQGIKTFFQDYITSTSLRLKLIKESAKRLLPDVEQELDPTVVLPVITPAKDARPLERYIQTKDEKDVPVPLRKKNRIPRVGE